MALPVIVLKNQFGEESINNVLPGGTTVPGIEPVAAHTVIMNNTGASAQPSAVAVQSVSNALPAKAGVTAISAVATPDANTQTASYVQVDVQSIATLVNALKVEVNAILAALKVVS